jgi:hypothetical protein
MMCALAAASCISLAPSGFVVTDNVILKLSDVDRGEGAAAEGLAFSTRISIDMTH